MIVERAPGAAPDVDAEDAAAVRPHLKRRAWVSVDTAALAHNLRVVAALAGPAARVAAVVKADAYGHGLLPAAHAFLAAGAAMLCVATVDEVLLVRAAGVTAPILLLYPPPVAAVEELVSLDVTIPVSDEDGAWELAARLRELPMPAGGPWRVASSHAPSSSETGMVTSSETSSSTAATGGG